MERQACMKCMICVNCSMRTPEHAHMHTPACFDTITVSYHWYVQQYVCEEKIFFR